MGQHYDEKEARYIEAQGHFDANQSVFLARQLEHIRAQALQVKKAPLNAFFVFPVTTDVPEGAETATQRIYDSVGVAEIISNYGDDLPRVDLVAKEEPVKVFSLGGAYGYNENEIANAQFAGINLDATKADAVRQAIDRKINKLAWSGDTAHNITGFLNNPNITQFTNSTKVSAKSETDVIKFMNEFIRSVSVATNEVETVNTVCMAPDVYAHLAMTRMSNSDRTLLDFLKQVHPEVTRWLSVGELRGAASDGSDMMVVGYFDPSYIKLEIPLRLRQLPVERRNLEYIVNCMAKAIGVTVTIPYAFAKVEGV